MEIISPRIYAKASLTTCRNQCSAAEMSIAHHITGSVRALESLGIVAQHPCHCHLKSAVMMLHSRHPEEPGRPEHRLVR